MSVRMSSVTTWHPESWREREAFQQPQYHDREHAEEILRGIARKPPLVFPGEVDTLRTQLAEAAAGKRFILQGGDCVERFSDCNEHTITNKLKIMLQMSVILTHAARKPVVRIGRIAGQYCKPRSRRTEIIDGTEVLTYRGDAINGMSKVERVPDPERLLQGYFHSGLTSNYLRALTGGGFADLHHPYNWNLYAIEKTPKWDEYRVVLEQILDAIRFMESFGGANTEQLGRVEFFTSHEALHLGYEAALTRRVEGEYYNLGAHLVWAGDRSRSLSGAHTEYLRGIRNPVGLKVGPEADIGELLEILRVLNPENLSGKTVLITRLGRERVADLLPLLIERVGAAHLPVVWSCDPMHGNTRVASEGSRKTRSFGDILEETRVSYEVHGRMGSHLAGIHFELTGEEVTECTGGAVDLHDNDLSRNYQSYCDPRLNYAQSLEMAFLVARLLKP